MNRLAFILFLLVLSTHYGYEPAVNLFSAGTPARWFYVLRGFEGFALYLILLALLRRNWQAMTVCAWGSIEEGLTASCRLTLGLDNPPSDRPQCDAITGLPIYAATLVVVLWVLIKTLKDR